MSNDKQQVAEAIKHLVAELQTEMEKARQLGLTVVLENPARYLGATNEVAVKMYEQVSY